MSIDISLLLAANGITVVTGHRRMAAALSVGMSITVVDQEGTKLDVTFQDGKLVVKEVAQFKGHALMVRRELVSPVSVTLINGNKLDLLPVPMSYIPSSDPMKWLEFVGNHVPGTEMNEIEESRLQVYMRKHKTEALTDGSAFLTLAGNVLVLCHP